MSLWLSRLKGRNLVYVALNFTGFAAAFTRFIHLVLFKPYHNHLFVHKAVHLVCLLILSNSCLYKPIVYGVYGGGKEEEFRLSIFFQKEPTTSYDNSHTLKCMNVESQNLKILHYLAIYYPTLINFPTVKFIKCLVVGFLIEFEIC